MLKDLLFNDDVAAGKWENVNLNNLAKAHFPVREFDWVDQLHTMLKIDHSYGGYLEDRSYLHQDTYIAPGHAIHVGVDYNVKKGTEVFLPAIGRLVLVENDPDMNGGWGKRVIFKIEDLWITFAHLSPRYDINLEVDRVYPQFTYIGTVGSHLQNGGWFPHLHIHCMREYRPFQDAYMKYYDGIEKDFPDPEIALSY